MATDQIASGASGLERLLKTLADGHAGAPIAKTLRFRAVDYGFGRAVFEANPDEIHYNNAGTVHGGFFAVLLDSAMSCAVFSALAPGQTSSTTALSMGLTRAITTASGRLRCEGELLRLGRTTGHAAGRLFDGEGRLCGYGTAVCAIMSATS